MRTEVGPEEGLQRRGGAHHRRRRRTHAVAAWLRPSLPWSSRLLLLLLLSCDLGPGASSSSSLQRPPRLQRTFRPRLMRTAARTTATRAKERKRKALLPRHPCRPPRPRLRLHHRRRARRRRRRRRPRRRRRRKRRRRRPTSPARRRVASRACCRSAPSPRQPLPLLPGWACCWGEAPDPRRRARRALPLLLEATLPLLSPPRLPPPPLLPLPPRPPRSRRRRTPPGRR